MTYLKILAPLSLVGLTKSTGVTYSDSVHIEESRMPNQTTYTKARANLAKLCNQVAANREIVIINRRGAEDVALVAASELSSLLETAHLLRSPKNARRLLSALNRAKARKVKPQSLKQLRQEIGLDAKE